MTDEGRDDDIQRSASHAFVTRTTRAASEYVSHAQGMRNEAEHAHQVREATGGKRRAWWQFWRR